MSLAPAIPCEWCGERLDEFDDAAELSMPGKDNIVVHAEPCAFDAMREGWERA